MAVPKIIFNDVAGNIPRNVDTDDGVTLFVFNGNKPTSYQTSDVKSFNSLRAIETAGITSAAYSDEHKAITGFWDAAQGAGTLWIGFIAGAGTAGEDYQQILDFLRVAQGAVQIVKVFANSVFSEQFISTLQTRAEQADTENMPVIILNQALYSTFTDLNTLPDFSSSTNHFVAGPQLTKYDQTSKWIGEDAGLLSRLPVHIALGYGAEGDVSGTNLAEFVWGNDDEYVTNSSVSFLDTLSNKHYIFVRKFPRVVGSWHGKSWTCSGGDMQTIDKVRVRNKAKFLLRNSLFSYLEYPVLVNSAGNLSVDTIETFKARASEGLSQMQEAGEISAYEVEIPANQNVLTNNTIQINTTITPIGTASEIEINQAFGVTQA